MHDALVKTRITAHDHGHAEGLSWSCPRAEIACTISSYPFDHEMPVAFPSATHSVLHVKLLSSQDAGRGSQQGSWTPPVIPLGTLDFTSLRFLLGSDPHHSQFEGCCPTNGRSLEPDQAPRSTASCCKPGYWKPCSGRPGNSQSGLPLRPIVDSTEPRSQRKKEAAKLAFALHSSAP